MAKKKAKKAESQGSAAGAFVLGLLAAALGMILGIFSLSLIGVEEVREMPEEEKVKDDAVYFVMGKDRGGVYKNKEAAFLQERVGIIPLTEEDLNDWAADTFVFARPKPGEEPEGLVTLKPSTPNFMIEGGVFQIGMSVEVGFGEKQHKMRFQTRGYFERGGGSFQFIPTETYLGSAKLPAIAVAPTVCSKLFEVFETNEEYTELNRAWNGLSSVAVEGDQLVLTRQ